MASDSDSPSVTDDAKVVITLASSNSGPHSVIPTRRITLRNNIPERVGRASKVATKGFLATPDNAWFDSPVMSRTHAELVANMEKKTVSIKDIGSLHGTFIIKKDIPNSETRVAEDTPTELISGDNIRFGVEILRGRDRFPPCEVDFTVDWPNADTSLPDRSASTNRFTVPDAEDEDEDMISDGESVMNTEDLTLPATFQDDQPVIDLTQEANVSHDSGNNRRKTKFVNGILLTTDYSSDVIDLTSEIDEDDQPPVCGYFGHESDMTKWYNKTVEDGDQNKSDAGPTQDSNVSGTASLNQASKESGDSIELRHAPEVISDLVAQQSGNLDNFGSVPNYLDSEDDYGDDDSIMSGERLPTDEDLRRGMRCCDDDTSESESGSEEEDDSESILSSDDDDVLLEEFTNSDDSDGEGTSDVDEPSYGPCFDADMVSSSDSESDDVENSIFDKTSTSTRSPKSSPVAIISKPALKLEPVYPASLPSANTIFGANSESESLQTTLPPNVVNSLSAIARQPSPSDAAMVKTSVPGPVLDGLSTAQVLGKKTGKYEYFAARDQNKETVQTAPALPAAPSKYPTDQAWDSCHQKENTLPSPFKVNHGAPNTVLPTPPSFPPQANNTQDMCHPEFNAASKAPWRTPSLESHTREPPVSGSPPPDCRTVQKSQSCLRQDADSDYAPPMWASSSFLDSSRGHVSPDPQKRTRFDSPEHDMTSAFTFERSKLAAAKSGEIKVLRNSRHMAIPALLSEDLQNTSSPAAPLFSPPSPSAADSLLKPTTIVAPRSSRCTKRNFDDFLEDDDLDSEYSEDDIDESSSMVSESSEIELGPAVNTPSPVRHCSPRDRVTTVSTLKPSITRHEAVAVQGQPSTRASAPAPPAKRRRLADFAACALGGAIGGAAVLVGLITSAPSISQM
ncbi:hypothetical protein PG990_011002 [Apiospora arundinis]